MMKAEEHGERQRKTKELKNPSRQYAIVCGHKESITVHDDYNDEVRIQEHGE